MNIYDLSKTHLTYHPFTEGKKTRRVANERFIQELSSRDSGTAASNALELATWQRGNVATGSGGVDGELVPFHESDLTRAIHQNLDMRSSL